MLSTTFIYEVWEGFCYAPRETGLKKTTEIAILPKLSFVPPSAHVMTQS